MVMVSINSPINYFHRMMPLKDECGNKNLSTPATKPVDPEGFIIGGSKGFMVALERPGKLLDMCNNAF